MNTESLERYKRRLVNFSGRNQTLKRNKIFSKRAFDMTKVLEYNSGLIENIFNEILNDSNNKIEIVNSNKNIVLNDEEVEKIKINFNILVKNSKKIKTNFKPEEINQILNKENKELIKKAFNVLKDEKIEKIKDEIITLKKQLDILKDEIDTIEKETGLYQLYVGYPYLEGKLEDGTEVRAPLFLYPCQLIKEDGKFLYQNLNDNSIYINRSFLLAYSSATKKDFKNLQDEYDTVEEIFNLENKIEDKKEYILKCVEFLKLNEIIIKNFSIDNFISTELYKDFKKETYERFSKGELNLKNYFLLGQFTIGDNSIYKDYEKMCENPKLTHEVVENLLVGDKEDISTVGEKYTIVEKTGKIDEQQSFFITDLDYSQEKAIKMAEELKSLVIYGPPGTGKSQVIANIISDSLAKNKKVLVVSEKRTALDVVYKRLEKCRLSERLAFVHDVKSDKKKIMGKIVDILDFIENNNETNIDNKVEEYSNEIEDKILTLDKFKEILFEKQSCGKTLFELYSNSKLNNGYLEEIYRNFEKYNIFTYDELMNFISKLEDLMKYCQYDVNPILSKRKNFNETGMNEIKSLELISDLKEIGEFFNKNIGNETINFYKNKKDYISKNLIENEEYKLKKYIDEYLIKVKEINDILHKKVLYNKMILNKNIEERRNKIFQYILLDLAKKIKNIENLNDDLKNIDKFNIDIYKDIENLKTKRKEFLTLPFFSIFRKIKLKKEFMNLEYGNTLEDKLKKIEEISDIKRKNEEILKYFVFNMNINNERILKFEIENKLNYLNKLKENIITKKELEENVEFSEENNNEIKIINNLIEKYNFLCNDLETIKEKIDEKNYKDLFEIVLELKNEDEKFRKYQIQINKNKEDIKDDLSKININSINSLEELKNIFKKYNLSSDDINNLDELILELKNIFGKISKLKENFDFSTEEIYNNFFKNKNFPFIYLAKVLEEKFNEIEYYDIEKDKFNEIEKVIFNMFLLNNNKQFLKELKNTYCLKWIEEIQDKNKNVLREIQFFNNIKDLAFNLIQEKKKLIPKYILEKWDKKIRDNFSYSSRTQKEMTYKDLRVEATKKRKTLSLRNYIERFQDRGLFDILPCWLLTPEVVSEILPLKKDLFDVIVFDEASQIFLEKTIPAIYRAKSIVIAGDDKQLQPNSVAKRKLDLEEEKEEDIEEDDLDDVAIEEKSLLDVAQKMYKSCLLSYHYRSSYAELINFSNYAFYKGKLIVAPNKNEIEDNIPPIERIKINGVWENKKNLKEAEEVFTLLKRILIERKNNESIGIVTFNEAQRELIRSFLEEQCEKDTEFRELYQKEKIRHDDTEDKSIFIKNIENVQGDERDIIIFSIAYAKDIETGKVYTRFGTLGQRGGENRLNVAISRAKKKIYVITSIEPEELKVENAKNNGPILLKKYLEYVRAVSEKNKKRENDILNSLTILDENKDNITEHFDSDFEKEVYDELKKCNLDVHTQIGVSGYKIDLGIYSKEKSEYILGDGATYHSSPSARERDIYRQKFLESKGWIIHRIWSKNWWSNPKKEIEKIQNLLKNMI